MGLPIVELIARDVLATVAGVKEAAGFNYNLTAQRHSVDGDKEVHLNAVIVQQDPELLNDKVPNTNEWLQSFEVGVFILPAQGDPTPIDQYVNLIRSDVERAVMVDRYRSGNALDTRIRAPRLAATEGLEGDIIVINVEVNYRTSELDPTVNAR